MLLDGVSVGEGAVVGANATILREVRLGRQCIVSAGSVVNRDVPPRVIVAGNPAAIVGYVTSANRACAPQLASAKPLSADSSSPPDLSGVPGLVLLPEVSDIRGSLSAAEFGAQLPFQPRRYFLVFGVPSAEVRGEHAHRNCHQFLVCVSGSCHVVVDNGKERHEVALDRKNLGLYLPPMTWGVQYKYSSDAVLLVLASHLYDPADYIRDYQEFLALVATHELQ